MAELAAVPVRLLAVATQRSPDACWHLVRAVRRGDEKVSESLNRCGFSVYYPQILEMRPLSKREMSPGQRRTGVEICRPRLAPLFPGYIFARFDMATSRWREAFNVAGGAGLVCVGGLPVPVTQAFLDKVKGLETRGAIMARSEKFRAVFAIGQEVRINSGPFAEHYGQMQTALDMPFDEVDADTRVKVALNLFGRATDVELDICQVESV